MMINPTDVQNEYFEWMYRLVTTGGARGVSFRKLFSHLHSREFTYIIPKDKNRAEDGLDLRYRFAYEHPEIDDIELYLYGPCSMLEMMLALAIRCEETIMDDPMYGNRMTQWFWGMVCSLGLGGITDEVYTRLYVDSCIDRFLNREYEYNGRGGLFTIENTTKDMRSAEIWYQLSWYLNSII